MSKAPVVKLSPYEMALNRLNDLPRDLDRIFTAALGHLRQERDEARAEVQRLTDERDELLARVADQGAELRATREAYGISYRRGAEAMQNACAATIHEGGLVWTRESAERALREIGILEKP